MTDFHNCKSVSAAKAHRCENCRQPIEKGEQHVYSIGRMDGDFYSYRTHEDCHAAIMDAVEANNGEPVQFMCDDAVDDAWLWADHPSVARRLGLPEPVKESA